MLIIRMIISDIFSNKKLLFCCLLFFTILSLFVFFTGFGISTQIDYWYGAGVPVLWVQVVVSLAVGALFSWIINKVKIKKNNDKFDLLIFIFIWLVCSYLWGSQPLRSSFFMSDTGSNPLFPYSDSATFDIGSQYAVIGQGLFNGQYFDRSLYSAFLTYLHVIAGQNLGNLMIAQAVIYSIFPAIVYLLGRELYGHVFGISVACLLILRGVNSIVGTSLIDMAGPKMMLTDFPTAIGISLVLTLLVKWLKKPSAIVNVFWAGAIIGSTLLLRTHAILLVPFIIIYLWLYFKIKKIFWISGSVLLIFGMLTFTMPLDIQNQRKGLPMFYMYYSRIELVLKARYGIIFYPNSSVPEENKNRLWAREHNRLKIKDDVLNVDCNAASCSIAKHFIHNLAASFLYLPSSFEMNDLRTTVKETVPYWRHDWKGEDVSAQNYFLIFVNIIIVSIGIGEIGGRLKIIGLLPLYIFIVYMLSNSLALTSGGRYITPVDWIICMYYIAGLLEIGQWLVRHFNINRSEDFETISDSVDYALRISYRSLAGSLVAVFMVGSLIPAADYLFPRRYQEKTTLDVLVLLDQKGLLQIAGLHQTAVEGFLNNPDARLTYGRLLYPRFYPSNKGEPGSDYPYTALDYRRLVFTVIGPFGIIPEGVILPMENSVPGLHALDVAVLGCKNRDFLDALVVFILSEPQQVFIRPTGVTLQCPLPGP